jgi:DDE family transposase
MTQQCHSRATKLTSQAHSLHQELKKAMRCFGRQCRGQGHVFVKLVRQTEQKLLALGEPITALGQQAQHLLAQASGLSDAKRARLAEAFNAALSSHAHIRTQSTRLTHGKKLHHCKRVNAYDLTIAPIMKGKSNCPAQFGRKTGILSEPTTGFIFAYRVPEGNPSDPSYVVPLLDNVRDAIARVQAPRKPQVHSVAGDLGVNDAALRQALHARGILSVGIPQTVAPINPEPSPTEILDRLNAAGLNRQRTPHQVQLACACGYSRPVVESHIASLLSRGAGQVRYKGLHGAVVQLGMAVMAHNGAAMVRIRQQRLSKRAQKFRRLLGLRRRNVNQINDSKN